MLLARPAGTPAREIGPDVDINDINWIDLINPTHDEITKAETLLGVHIPTQDELEEIESSSRHYERDHCLYLSTPLVRRADDVSFSKPIGFILTEKRIITVRYTDYFAFDLVGRRLAEYPTGKISPSSTDLLVELIEEIINRLADILEGLGRTLDTISRRVFNAEQPRDRARVGAMLRETLRRLGYAGDLASTVRDSLLGIDRVRIYLEDYISQSLQKVKDQGTSPLPTRDTAGKSPTPADTFKSRLKVAGRDIASLSDFDAQIVSKVQFLLDATLGFISIEQNDGMKVLTVASSIGIMPTLIAGIYGMNFKDMPELSWKYGYPYGLALMVLSIILPLIWFWRRGWFGTR
ncbi:magnesium/cobalt transporter CorA [Gluconobacter japonicus]|nr:magnesium/cobalt transporter CorA [Gluconobacter japonicus]